MVSVVTTSKSIVPWCLYNSTSSPGNNWHLHQMWSLVFTILELLPHLPWANEFMYMLHNGRPWIGYSLESHKSATYNFGPKSRLIGCGCTRLHFKSVSMVDNNTLRPEYPFLHIYQVVNMFRNRKSISFSSREVLPADNLSRNKVQDTIFIGELLCTMCSLVPVDIPNFRIPHLMPPSLVIWLQHICDWCCFCWSTTWFQKVPTLNPSRTRAVPKHDRHSVCTVLVTVFTFRYDNKTVLRLPYLCNETITWGSLICIMCSAVKALKYVSHWSLLIIISI